MKYERRSGKNIAPQKGILIRKIDESGGIISSKRIDFLGYLVKKCVKNACIVNL